MLRRVFVNEEWSIAYREKRAGENILTNKNAPFTVLKNNWRYWCADPFLVEEGEALFLFFEAYDRILRRGVIGYREVKNNSTGKIRIIITEPFHLSYPFIYREKGVWYMIPESRQNNEVSRYKAASFPDQWLKERTLIDNIGSVDATLFSGTDKKAHMFLYAGKEGNREFQCLLQEGEGYKLIASEKDEKGIKRPAGNVFWHHQSWYRPSQLCEASYGEALIFNRITALSDKLYEETEAARIFAHELNIKGKNRWEGIHTYNATENYEVIDMRINRISLVTGAVKLLSFVKKAIIKKNKAVAKKEENPASPY